MADNKEIDLYSDLLDNSELAISKDFSDQFFAEKMETLNKFFCLIPRHKGERRRFSEESALYYTRTK